MHEKRGRKYTKQFCCPQKGCGVRLGWFSEWPSPRRYAQKKYLRKRHGARRRAAHMHGWEMSFKCLAVKVRVPVWGRSWASVGHYGCCVPLISPPLPPCSVLETLLCAKQKKIQVQESPLSVRFCNFQRILASVFSSPLSPLFFTFLPRLAVI